jgi:Rad3-related DNA helicase
MNTQFKYREYQRETIDKINEAFKTHKLVFLDAPTGAGKSIINAFVCNEQGTAYMTTTQRQLVDQLQDTFDYVIPGIGVTIKGRDNYECAFAESINLKTENDEPITASDAPCVMGKFNGKSFTPTKCPEYQAGNCIYYNLRHKAMQSTIAATTMKYFVKGILPKLPIYTEQVIGGFNGNVGEVRVNWNALSEDNEDNDEEKEEPDTWKSRKVLVIDEAHTLSEALIDEYTLNFNDSVKLPDFNFGEFWKKVSKIPKGSENEDLKIAGILNESLLKYVEDKSIELDNIQMKMENIASGDPMLAVLGKDELRIAKAIHNANNKMTAIDPKEKYIFIRNDEEHDLTWKPYTIENMVRNQWNKFEKILLSSATFLNIPMLVKECGLPEDYAVVQVPNVFPKEKAKIYLANMAVLNKNNIEQNYGILAKEIERIAEKFKDSKGLVHCISYNNQYNLKKRLPSSRYITHNRGYDRERQRKAWEDSTGNGIFLSVGMEEGLDLKYDKARFQIIVKAPYPYFGDPWIQEHYKKDGQEWYDTKMLLKVLQAAGRVMRAKDDSGYTYILDGKVRKLIMEYKDKLPLWFKERLTFLI